MAPLTTMPNEKLTKMVERIADLAVLPHVVFKVLEITGSEDAPSHEIERAITIDPGFSSKVLVLANSAAFGLPRKVTSIKEAVMFLGFRTIRTVAMTVGVFDLFVGKNDKESLRRRSWWRQSIDAAVAARFIARKSQKVPPDEAYTCGLLHLIGKTLMDRLEGSDYSQIEKVIEAGVPEAVAENHVYGFTHCEVAAEAAQKWGLPPALQSGLQYAVEPAEDDTYRALRATTALATQIVALAKLGFDPEMPCEVPAWALAELGFTKHDLTELIEGCSEAMASSDMRI